NFHVIRHTYKIPLDLFNGMFLDRKAAKNVWVPEQQNPLYKLFYREYDT
ncbi:MAG: hypothetical protein K0R47_5583, partial [Brevibacillus sp.]|nr:hypothetical protein [Brevibacillus sp.]